nr:AlkA N-terminal domain-containing protein [Reyranella sp. CPCC 100927]
MAYRPPYDWPAMLSFLAARAIPGVEVVAGERYARTIAIGGGKGTLMVEPAAGPRVKVTVRFPHLRALPTIIARVRRVFDLAADPVTIGAHLAHDPALAPLVAARPGLRVPGAWDGFELAVRAILGQQITVAAATGLAGKLVRAHGEVLPPSDGAMPGLTHVFPTSQRLASADVAALGMPGARAAALRSMAAAVTADPMLFGPRRSLDEAITQLQSLSGIGEWTAQYIAMRELREPDAFPASDIGLLRAMADAAGTRPSPAQLLARAEAWRPWRAYAALHLWAADASSTPLDREIADDRRAA